jgi:phospholipid/cholesterol/gamma-HCH transport system ATP-binding protein
MESTDYVIQVRDLVAHYDDVQILDGVNLDVRRQEILVIMGGSGSGKSTLFRHLLGLQSPTSGTIRVLDQEVSGARKHELYRLRRNIGVAFQGGALFSSMSLLDNVELPLRQNTGLDENTIRIMARMKLELMNLNGCEDLMPSQLSGGMAKRAGLARAVVMDPKLLFFDEPSAGLDPVTAAELDDLILKLREAMRMTIVVVTHELHSALKIADRIVVIDRGRVLTTGTVDEVRNSGNAHIQNMLARRPRETNVDADDYLGRLTR